MSATIWIVTNPEDMVAEIVAGRLRSRGQLVHIGAPAAVEALARSAGTSGTSAALLAVVDAQHPDSLAWLQARKDSMRTMRVVLLLAEAQAKPRSVRVEGDVTLIEPFEIRDLNEAIDNLLASANVAPDEEWLTVALPTTDDALEAGRGLIEQRIHALSELDEVAQFQLESAFREAIGNAAQHGNRHRRDRAVRLTWCKRADGVSLRVQDEGPGFDWRAMQTSDDAVAQAATREAQGKLGGLGMNLMRKVCDDVRYNDAGNELTLTKRLK